MMKQSLVCEILISSSAAAAAATATASHTHARTRKHTCTHCTHIQIQIMNWRRSKYMHGPLALYIQCFLTRDRTGHNRTEGNRREQKGTEREQRSSRREQ